MYMLLCRSGTPVKDKVEVLGIDLAWNIWVDAQIQEILSALFVRSVRPFAAEFRLSLFGSFFLPTLVLAPVVAFVLYAPPSAALGWSLPA